MFKGARPRKRWRYVALFDEQVMVCAAIVQVGPARQSFWAIHTREDGRMRERTRLLPRRGRLELSPGRMAVCDDGVLLDVELSEDDGIQALCPHGRQRVWTRKQAGIAARGRLSLDGGPARTIDALAVIDDTSGHHARVTEWFWTAGVGRGPDGIALAWNLVSGVNDPPHGSERAVWVDGEPREVPAVSFAPDLSEIRAEDGSLLSFIAMAERNRSENLLILRSDYRAPFGSFHGSLPGGARLAEGLGVVEYHRAHW